MTIKYCLSLAPKSAAAYDEIWYDTNKGTGFVILPSRRRLRDYINYIKPQWGFSHKIIREFHLKISDFSEQQKFMPEKFVVLQNVLKMPSGNLQHNKFLFSKTSRRLGKQDIV